MRFLRGTVNFLFEADLFKEWLLTKDDGSSILSSDPVLH